MLQIIAPNHLTVFLTVPPGLLATLSSPRPTVILMIVGSCDGGRHGWTKIIRHGWIRRDFNEIDNFIKSVNPLLVFDCTANTTTTATTVPVLLSVEACLVVVLAS